MKLRKNISVLVALLAAFNIFIYAHTADNGGHDGEKKKAGSSRQQHPVEKSTEEFSQLNSTRIFPGETPLPSAESLFDTDPISVVYQPDGAAANDVNRAHDLFDYVIRENRITDFLSDGSLQSLPVGIRKTIGNKQYIIVVDSMVLTPTAAYLVAYMSLPIPQSDQRLAFKGSNIRFTKAGGLTGNVRLTLLENISIPVSNHSQINILSDHGETFIDWDCSGFKSLGLNAEVEFSRDYLVPDNNDGSTGEGRVKGNFKTVVNDWNDLIAEVTITPFQMTKLKGFGFYVNRAVFDFSDINNAPGIDFPADYQSNLIMQDNVNLWQGFYLKELDIKLPSQFASKDGRRRQLQGTDLFIDNLGFSGNLVAKKILSLDEGTMSGWKFSLDSLGISLVTNEIKAGSFTGQLHVPVFKDDQLFTYSATITADNDYLFSVKNGSTMDMSLMAAKAEIDKNSYLEIHVINGKFKPKAVLNGKLTITASMSSDKPSGAKTYIGDLSFEMLQITTESPYITVGAFSLGGKSAGGEPKVGNFPIGIENVDFKKDGDELNLAFDIVVKLVGSGDGGFGARGGLLVKSKATYGIDGVSFGFEGVEVTSLDIKIDGGAYTIEGSLTFFKDDIKFGNGIRGTVSASFQPGINVQAIALFGTINGDRYWFADALAKFERGVVIFPGLAIYGFGGGAYYHMKQQGYGTGGISLGASLSGIVYTPDPRTFLGIKATVMLGTHPNPEAFNGDATLEIAFNNSGGVNAVSFLGNSYFAAPPLPAELADLKKKAEALSKATGQQSPFDDSKGSIYARLFVTFDIQNQTLHGNLTTYANVGGGVIKGAGANNLCGEAVLHFSPDEWYIHIGTPENRMALSLAGFFTVQGYMMVGTNIPAMPPPPAEVMSILHGVDMSRSEQVEALSTGNGFAFGASFSYSTGDLRFLMFYARLDAGAGFDVMLKNYGAEARCDGSAGPIGINGWYASGQAYGYFRGVIGITIDLTFYSGDFDIINLSAAVLLRAKLPNPIFLQGTVGGRFSILDGLVSGDCQFQMTIGEECQIRGGGALQGQKVIAAVTPSQGEENVSVFTAPQVVFNMPIDKQFEFTNSDKVTRSFRARLTTFKMSAGGKEIPALLNWNADKTVAAISASDILPSKKDIKVVVMISFEEKVSNMWRALYVDGKVATESRELTFSTGDAPDYIPPSNVLYSYPLTGQYNFYPQESNKGYIKLRQGQPEIFKTSTTWKLRGRFSNAMGQKLEFPITYSDKLISFTIPQGFANNTIYKFEIVRTPTEVQQALDNNVRESTSTIGNTDVAMRTRTAEGTIKILKEKAMLSFTFRTSRFNRFLDKIASLTIGEAASYPIYPDVHQIVVRMEGEEMFDKYEVQGSENFLKLVQFDADLTNPWYAQFMGPLVYAGYPYPGATITHRAVEILGVPPVHGVYLAQSDNAQLLTDAEIANGISNGTGRISTINHNFIFEVFQDYLDLQQKAAYQAQFKNEAWIHRFLTGEFRPIMPGKYKLKMRYVLPGIGETTSETSSFTLNLN